MPLGFEIPSTANRTFRTFVSKFATSIVNFLESVQKIFLADQSIETPSGEITPGKKYKMLLLLIVSSQVIICLIFAERAYLLLRKVQILIHHKIHV